MRWQLAAALAVLATPGFAEAPKPSAALQAKNADVLLSKYPPRALAAGEQGSVYFKVELDRDGQAKSCQVIASSGHPRLDAETCDLILLHAVFQPPKEIKGMHGSSTHDGVVNWKIPGGATVTSPAPVRLSAAKSPEKKICKRTVRTGTLSSFERVCMTKREWQRSRDETAEPWEELQGRKGMTAGQ